MTAQIDGGGEVDGGVDEWLSVGFFGLERESGGRGSSQRCHLGRRGSDGGQ
jgi:hypothetical protein